MYKSPILEHHDLDGPVLGGYQAQVGNGAGLNEGANFHGGPMLPMQVNPDGLAVNNNTGHPQTAAQRTGGLPAPVLPGFDPDSGGDGFGARDEVLNDPNSPLYKPPPMSRQTNLQWQQGLGGVSGHIDPKADAELDSLNKADSTKKANDWNLENPFWRGKLDSTGKPYSYSNPGPE